MDFTPDGQELFNELMKWETYSVSELTDRAMVIANKGRTWEPQYRQTNPYEITLIRAGHVRSHQRMWEVLEASEPGRHMGETLNAIPLRAPREVREAIEAAGTEIDLIFELRACPFYVWKGRQARTRRARAADPRRQTK